jgi:hypothetical protein
VVCCFLWWDLIKITFRILTFFTPAKSRKSIRLCTKAGLLFINFFISALSKRNSAQFQLGHGAIGEKEKNI